MESHSIDARVIGSSSRPVITRTTASIGVLNITADSIAYDMKHKYRGKCLIFNHQNFDAHTGCRPRLGTDRDANAVAKCFHNRDFDVIQMMDSSYRDIRDLLLKVSAEDHTDNDCIVVVVLSHGDEESLWARDSKYPIDSLFSHFAGHRCPSLIGKPKIFIIQACRGEQLDSGSKVMALGLDVTDGPQPFYRIPSIADYLVYYSTAPGHYSFRNTEFGSYFIQTLVSVMNEYSDRYIVDLITLFTIVNRRVAFEFESNVPDDKRYHRKKQIPCIQSLLTRLVYLIPKGIPSGKISTNL